MFQKYLEVEDLISPEHWQNIQDLFSDAFEITLRTVAIDKTGEILFSIPSRPLRLCEIFCSKASASSHFCDKCIIIKNVRSLTDIKETANTRCVFGLDTFVIPIKSVGSKIFAYIIVGPLNLEGRKNESQYAKDAAALGISMEELNDAIVEINTFTHTKVYSINGLIELVFSNMVQSAHHKKRLGEIAPEIAEMDPIFMRYHEEKILNALLKACTVALDADSGSVMTVDKKTNMLSVKVSSRVEDDSKNEIWELY